MLEAQGSQKQQCQKFVKQNNKGSWFVQLQLQVQVVSPPPLPPPLQDPILSTNDPNKARYLLKFVIF
jgi:hypothetical protein